MFAHILALVPFALLASAANLAARDQCQTGELQCCNSVQTATPGNPVLDLLDLLDVVADVGALVGVSCSPISVLGDGAGCKASQQPICCTNNQFNGVISLGCSDIDS